MFVGRIGMARGMARVPNKIYLQHIRLYSNLKIGSKSPILSSLHKPIIYKSFQFPSQSNRFMSSRSSDVPKIRYFLLAAAVCFGIFALAANSLDKKAPPSNTMKLTDMDNTTQGSKFRRKQMSFPVGTVSVIFVLGGPSSGKSLQCEKIAKDYDFVHLSLTDLVKQEQSDPDTKYKKLVNNGILPSHDAMVEVFSKAMIKINKEEGKTKFLIEGFPRKLEQAFKFEEDVTIAKLILLLDLPDEISTQRLLKTNPEASKELVERRVQLTNELNSTVVYYFKAVGKVATVDASGSPDKVYKDIQEALHEKLDLEKK